MSLIECEWATDGRFHKVCGEDYFRISHIANLPEDEGLANQGMAYIFAQEAAKEAVKVMQCREAGELFPISTKVETPQGPMLGSEGIDPREWSWDRIREYIAKHPRVWLQEKADRGSVTHWIAGQFDNACGPGSKDGMTPLNLMTVMSGVIEDSMYRCDPDETLPYAAAVVDFWQNVTKTYGMEVNVVNHETKAAGRIDWFGELGFDWAKDDVFTIDIKTSSKPTTPRLGHYIQQGGYLTCPEILVPEGGKYRSEPVDFTPYRALILSVGPWAWSLYEIQDPVKWGAIFRHSIAIAHAAKSLKGESKRMESKNLDGFEISEYTEEDDA